jgi:phosphatidylinositol dimannoside acyltransferase
MVLRRLAQRIRGEIRDLIELVLVPSLAIILPWTWCYRVFLLLSRCEWLYWADGIAHCERAREFGWVKDAEDFRRKWRLMSMVDQADFYLALFRSNRWMRRHMDVEGNWPEPGKAAVLCTFHWGAGMWALRHLGASGLRAHALVGPQRPEMFPGHRLRYQYFRLRNIGVRNALRTEPLDITGSLRPMLKALRAGDQIAAAVDVPAYLSSSSQTIAFLGLRARFPRGLFRLAADQGTPVTIFVNGLRFGDGRRFLRLYDIGVERDVDALMAKVYAYLEALIRAEPAAWHFWRISDSFFEKREDA